MLLSGYNLLLSLFIIIIIIIIIITNFQTRLVSFMWQTVKKDINLG